MDSRRDIAEGGMSIPEGYLPVGSEFGNALGFTADKFDGDSYLWGDPSQNRLTVSFVSAKRKGEGAFTTFLKNALDAGYVIAVPTPSNVMRGLLERRGFQVIWEDTNMGACEVMISKLPPAPDDTPRCADHEMMTPCVKCQEKE